MPAQNYISVLEKSIRVLEAFQGESEVPLGELTSRTGLVKSGVFRVLFTLERLGYVEKRPGGRYSISGRLGRLAGGQWPSPELGTLAAPFMAELLRRFQETVNLGVIDDGEVLYIRVLESHHVFRLAAHAGMRSHLHSTALGKCLLCRMPHGEIEATLKRRPLNPMTPRTIRDRTALYRELGRVRRRGYAIDNEEDSRGARCVAAPILDPAGHVRAAISISGPATRVTPAGDAERAKALMEACGRISTLLGYTPAPRAVGRTGVR